MKKLKQIIKEEITLLENESDDGLNLYKFKKLLKKKLAKYGLFIDDIAVDNDLNISIKIHPSYKSVIRPMQYYVVLAHMLKDKGIVGEQNKEMGKYYNTFNLFEEDPRKLNLLLVNKFNSLYNKKPKFNYTSNLYDYKLKDVLIQIEGTIKKLIDLTYFDEDLDVEDYMKEKFISTQINLLKNEGVFVDIYQSIDTTITLRNPKHDEEDIREVTFKLNLDKKIYYIVGSIVVEFDHPVKNKYEYSFTNLNQLKKIIINILSSLEELKY